MRPDSFEMPFTVSCPACDSRFLLGDDLFRRKVSGNIVTVKCRHCEAEISVDARDVDTMPSHQSPRRAPAPPRPKEKMGLVPPPRGATSTPLASDGGSIWDAEHPASITLKADNEPESIDFQEIEPSRSSDAPPLDTLMHEPGLVHPPRRKHQPDEFLVNLSAGTGGILGAPTIDVSGLGSPPSQPDVEDFEIVPQVPQLAAPRASMGTIPLFDMSAVLPAASTMAALGTPSAELLKIDFGPGTAPVPQSSKARERKYVVAPEDVEGNAPPAARRANRGGVFVWLAAAAVAAGVLAVVSLGDSGTPRVVATVSTAASEPHSPAPTDAEPIADAPTAEPIPTALPATQRSALAVNAAPASAATIIPTHKGKAVQAPSSEPSEPSETASNSEEATTPATVSTPTGAVKQAVEPATPGTDFDRSAAVSALKSAAAQASSCRKDGDPSGTATLTITFAESGRVTTATIQGPPFAGTATGGCIASTMRHVQIPAFDGDRVTVTKLVVIE